jgi:hypothetical protein
VVEGGAGEGEVLGYLQVGQCPDERVVSGVSVAQREADGVCGHGPVSFSLCLADGEAAVAESAVEGRRGGLQGVAVSTWAGVDEADLAVLLEQEEVEDSVPSVRIIGGAWVRRDG